MTAREWVIVIDAGCLVLLVLAVIVTQIIHVHLSRTQRRLQEALAKKRKVPDALREN